MYTKAARFREMVVLLAQRSVVGPPLSSYRPDEEVDESDDDTEEARDDDDANTNEEN